MQQHRFARSFASHVAQAGVLGLMPMALATVAASSTAAQCTADPTTTWSCGAPAYFQALPQDAGTPYETRLAHLGVDVAGGGDWNGDDLFDVLLGGMQLPFFDLDVGGSCPWPNEDTARDRAYLVLGWSPACPTPPTACNHFDNTWNKTIQFANPATPPARGDRLGWRARFLGNVDGHPGDEIVISAPLADIPFQNAGAVYVISWQVDVLALPMSFDPEIGVPGAKVLRIRGLEAHDQLGFSLTGGANVLGDSKPDLIIGAPSGPVPLPDFGNPPPTSGKAIVVDGAALDSAFDSVEVGGVADFPLAVVQEPFPIPMPAGTNAVLLRGEVPESRFGHAVAVIGDLDAPSGGAAEIAIGATGAWWQCAESTKALQYVAAPLDRGSVKVYSITTLSDPFVAWVPTERKRLLGESRGDLFGFSASGFNVGVAFIGGDATGDGVPDLLVGAPTNDGSGAAPDVGEIYLYSGASLQGGGDVSPVFSVFGDVGSEYFGWDVAGGGDVDGDGLREFAGSSRNFSLPLTITPPPGCMTQAGSSEELYGRGTSIGRVRVFCGAPLPDGTHVQIDEFWGMQHKGHLGWSICWLPSMDGNARTELLMGMAAYQTCITCADDPGADIGRGQVWFY